jgi:hypothetical protein
MLLMATTLFEHRGESIADNIKLAGAYEYLLARFARPNYP